MINFSVEDKKYSIPTTWEEVTFNQWLKLDKDLTTLGIVSVLTGLTESELKGIDVNDLLPYLEWITNDFDLEKLNTPKVFAGAIVPIDLKEQTYGQKILLQQIMINQQKNELPIRECIPMAVSIYMQPVVSKTEFDPDNINGIVEYSKKVGDMKLCEVYPVGAFFLRRCIKF